MWLAEQSAPRQIALFVCFCLVVAHFHAEVDVVNDQHVQVRIEGSSQSIDPQPLHKNTEQHHQANIGVVSPADGPQVSDDTGVAYSQQLVSRALQAHPPSQLCRFDVSWARADHGVTKVFKTVSVHGLEQDEFVFDFKCDFESDAGKMCYKNYDAGAGVLIPVDDPNYHAGYGTCCTVDNVVLSQTKRACVRPHDTTDQSLDSDKEEVVDTKPTTTNQIQSQPDHKRRIPMKIFVLTCCRTASLRRLLESLRQTEFDGDQIDLSIMVDLPVGQTAHNVDIVSISDTFTKEWHIGHANVVKQPSNQGLKGQWINSWQPNSSEVGLAAIFEDDLQLSRYWYRWATRAHTAYKSRSEIVGYTLQRANLNASGGDPLDGGPPGVSNFMYKLIGTWGLVLKAQQWHEFRSWYYKSKRIGNFKPYTPAAKILTDWYKDFEKAGTADKRMWSIWMIKFCDTYNKFFLYAKCTRGKTLSSNLAEPGLNFASKGKIDFPRLEIEDSSIYDFPTAPRQLWWNGLEVN